MKPQPFTFYEHSTDLPLHLLLMMKPDATATYFKISDAIHTRKDPRFTTYGEDI